MSCHQVQESLGRFHDGEMDPPERAAVEVHLGECPVCAGQLAAIAELGQLARALGQPEPPAELWVQLAHRLGKAQPVRPMVVGKIGWTWKVAAVAALVLAAGITAWLVHRTAVPEQREAGPTPTIVAEEDPLLDDLLASGAGEPVSLQEAAEQVDFRVLTSADLPDGFRLQECCICRECCCPLVQCKFRHGGKQIVLAQGSPDHPVRYGNRPVLETKVNGKVARVVRCGDCLACSWRNKETALTLFGPSDLSQLVHLVAYVDQRLESKSGAP